MIHTGNSDNADDLWRQEPHLVRRADVDTEVIAALIDDGLMRGSPPAMVTAGVFHRIHGAASVAWVHGQGAYAILATNTGDLYFHASEHGGYLIFASERFILDRALSALPAAAVTRAVQWVLPGTGLAVDLARLAVHTFSLNGSAHTAWPELPPLGDRVVRQHDLIAETRTQAPSVTARGADETLLRYDESRLRALRRCTRCVLPETFPFITFDSDGVCSYCHRYRPRYVGLDRQAAQRAFVERLAPYRRKDGAPDAIVAFSGGRDSSYGLHVLKTELGFNPITFTFDWGMLTDLARRNVARMCGQLGVQNILVSADIRAKRENIGKNVAAWLRAPDLGVVPLFMAGDKEFLRVVNVVKKQTGIALNVWSASPLENTDFKVGLCGISPDFEKEQLDSLSLTRKIKLVAYYGLAFAANPRYVNSSLFDSAKAFWAYYAEPRSHYYQLYNHIVWDEDTVNSTLLDRYGWETAPDTPSTWRIGDGTAAFYNYIYVTARGFSEFDTFRSNQIREGMLDRAAALEHVLQENRPRPASLMWYLNTIGIDFDAAIRSINALDTLGLHRRN